MLTSALSYPILSSYKKFKARAILLTAWWTFIVFACLDLNLLLGKPIGSAHSSIFIGMRSQRSSRTSIKDFIKNGFQLVYFSAALVGSWLALARCSNVVSHVDALGTSNISRSWYPILFVQWRLTLDWYWSRARHAESTTVGVPILASLVLPWPVYIWRSFPLPASLLCIQVRLSPFLFSR